MDLQAACLEYEGRVQAVARQLQVSAEHCGNRDDSNALKKPPRKNAAKPKAPHVPKLDVVVPSWAAAGEDCCSKRCYKRATQTLNFGLSTLLSYRRSPATRLARDEALRKCIIRQLNGELLLFLGPIQSPVHHAFGTVCRRSFAVLFGISQSTITKLSQPVEVSENNRATSFHASRVPTKQQLVYTWIIDNSRYYEYQPNQDSVHSGFRTVLHMYECFIAEMKAFAHDDDQHDHKQSEKIIPESISYRYFAKVLKSRAPHVMTSRFTRLAKCSVCINKSNLLRKFFLFLGLALRFMTLKSLRLSLYPLFLLPSARHLFVCVRSVSESA
jgi:hypothetical protein